MGSIWASVERMSPNKSSSFCHLTREQTDESEKEKNITRHQHQKELKPHIHELRGPYVSVCMCLCFVIFALIWHLSCSSCDGCQTRIKSFERLACCGITISHPSIESVKVECCVVFFVESKSQHRNCFGLKLLINCQSIAHTLCLPLSVCVIYWRIYLVLSLKIASGSNCLEFLRSPYGKIEKIRRFGENAFEYKLIVCYH